MRKLFFLNRNCLILLLFYDHSLETSDGTSRQEEGKVKDVGSEYPAIAVHGSFSWKDSFDGNVYTVTYVADENGFQPVGEHIPALPAAH